MKGSQIALVIIAILIIVGVVVVSSGMVALPSGFSSSTTIKDLYASPEAYDGKNVTVRGESRYAPFMPYEGIYAVPKYYSDVALEDRGYVLHLCTIPPSAIMDVYKTYQVTGKLVYISGTFIMECQTIERID